MASRNAEPTPPPSPPQYNDSYRPIWFVSRGNGVFVPVIAVDELPAGIELQGAPRTIIVKDACGMEFLGERPYHGQTYALEVDGIDSSKDHSTSSPGFHSLFAKEEYVNKQYSAPDSAVRKGQSQTYSLGNHTVSQMSLRPLRLSSLSNPQTRTPADSDPATPPMARKVAEKNPREDSMTLIDAIARSNPAVAARAGFPPSGSLPDQTKKEYCTYWIKWGECDYTQQGCLYKHEMPDIQTLRDVIGIKQVPRWWLQKTAVRLNAAGSSQVVQPPSWLRRRIDAAKMRADMEVEEVESSDDPGIEMPRCQSPSLQSPLVPTREAYQVPTAARAEIGISLASGDELIDLSVPDRVPIYSPTAAPAAASATTTCRPLSSTHTRRSIFIPAGEKPPPRSFPPVSPAPPRSTSTNSTFTPQTDLFHHIRTASAPPPPAPSPAPELQPSSSLNSSAKVAPLRRVLLEHRRYDVLPAAEEEGEEVEGEGVIGTPAALPATKTKTTTKPKLESQAGGRLSGLLASKYASRTMRYAIHVSDTDETASLSSLSSTLSGSSEAEEVVRGAARMSRREGSGLGAAMGRDARRVRVGGGGVAAPPPSPASTVASTSPALHAPAPLVHASTPVAPAPAPTPAPAPAPTPTPTPASRTHASTPTTSTATAKTITPQHRALRIRRLSNEEQRAKREKERVTRMSVKMGRLRG